MNRRMLFSIETGEEFEIYRNLWGFKVFQLFSLQERALLGRYKAEGELIDGLVELAILNGDDGRQRGVPTNYAELKSKSM